MKWCKNEMHIHGDTERLDEIRNACSKGELLGYLSRHPSIELTDQKSWRLENWGCEEEVRAESMYFRESSGKLVVGFESAWRPPSGAISAYCKVNRGITIESLFFEPLSDFGGLARNGVMYWGTSRVSRYVRENSKDPYFRSLQECFDVSNYYFPGDL